MLAVRHPCDVILSCYMQQFRAPDFALLCRSIESLALGFRRTFDYWYAQTALLGRRCTSSSTRISCATSSRARAPSPISSSCPGHESMLRPAERAQAKGFISTPSYAQVMQPVNSEIRRSLAALRETFRAAHCRRSSRTSSAGATRRRGGEQQVGREDVLVARLGRQALVLDTSSTAETPAGVRRAPRPRGRDAGKRVAPPRSTSLRYHSNTR